MNGVLYLHGVGDHTTDEKWRTTLEQSLQDLGYPGLDQVGVICAPKYTDLLSTDSLPKVAAPHRARDPKDDRLERRRAYELGQGRMRRLLAVDDVIDPPRGVFSGVPDDIVDGLTQGVTAFQPTLKQAGRYMRNANLRATILNRVLQELPQCDELVIIGHSLGSLVAIDLLDHLPPTCSVSRLVTLGSPAGLPVMHDNTERLLKDFPYGQVRSWVNVLSPLDPVTGGRGLTWLFAAAHDLRVDMPFKVHAASAYLRQPKVGLAVGEALFGSLSKEVDERRGTAVESLTTVESQGLFALAFAHMTLHEMSKSDPDSAKRYGEALAVVQAVVLEALTSVAHGQGRGVSSEVLNLKSGSAPPCPRAWTFEESVRLLVVTATTNLVAPWEIEVHKPAREALPAASVGLGFGAQQGSKVSQALAEARRALDLERDVAWGRLLLGAAGVAIVIAAPVGLALAAPAGLAGAAAVTSALAAFGPGGMIGGMAMAGTMVGTGAITAVSAALVDAPRAVLEIEVVRRVAHARARQLLGLPQDLLDWRLLTEMEGRAAEDLGRLSAFSDGNAPTLKELRLKAALVAKATRWMLERGLGQPVPEPHARQRGQDNMLAIGHKEGPK
ncbi:hypothetical protein [Terracoccus luteus]|uniref:Alpha/beta hydrolase family protein n=1 Tax=Terracoccus luteus TaxID=53356 RepID=A0A839PWT6_9MICO|nr:hypothetical protein [Terracoccus luteus]MBB2984861.1 hypothetical protein [Terracoccus luteus]MCP2174184.1 hypothetical protein [Terracoccus luteus]